MVASPATWTSCRKLAPGHWVLEGDVLDSYDFPLVVETAFIKAHENSTEELPVRLTFSGAGAFSLVYDIAAVEPSPDARSVMRSDMGVNSCGLKQSTLVPTEITTHIPTWTRSGRLRPRGTHCEPPLRIRTGCRQPWLLTSGLPTATTSPPSGSPRTQYDSPILPSGMTPTCSTVSYGTRTRLRLFKVFVEHRGESCIRSEMVVGDVEDHEGWQWTDSYQTTAQLPLNDGWLLVRAQDQATVVATIDDLRPFANLLVLTRSEETSTASSGEPQPLGWYRNFGANDVQCESAAIDINHDYQLLFAKGEQCFLTQLSNGVPVVWDVVVPTVEGDPIFTRHIFDGEIIWFLRDARADKYGSPSVTALDCHDLDLNTLAYEGSDCEPSDYPGFTGFAEAD